MGEFGRWYLALAPQRCGWRMRRQGTTFVRRVYRCLLPNEALLYRNLIGAQSISETLTKWRTSLRSCLPRWRIQQYINLSMPYPRLSPATIVTVRWLSLTSLYAVKSAIYFGQPILFSYLICSIASTPFIAITRVIRSHPAFRPYGTGGRALYAP
jgi:hypothetical protein